MDVWQGLAIAVPTFRRNEMLTKLLESIETQSTRPGLVLVVDNNSAGSAKAAVDEFAQRGTLRLDYLPMGRNTGPAGAFAAALSYLRGKEVEWMMCRGDDNPFPSAHAVREMHEFSARVAHLEPAGIGNRGVIYDERKARGASVSDEALRGAAWLGVDALPGGGSPTYHIERVHAAGANFDPFLFFGFEELDMGMQLNRAGCTLLVNSSAQLEIRNAHGGAEGPPRRVSPWRVYYYFRNSFIVGRRYASKGGVALMAAKRLVRVALNAAKYRSRSRTAAEAAGLLDGILKRPAREQYIPN